MSHGRLTIDWLHLSCFEQGALHLDYRPVGEAGKDKIPLSSVSRVTDNRPRGAASEFMSIFHGKQNRSAPNDAHPSFPEDKHLSLVRHSSVR